MGATKAEDSLSIGGEFVQTQDEKVKHNRSSAMTTGVSVEITGKAAVGQTAEGASSLHIEGKAAVESKSGRSLEIVGKAAVDNDVGSLEFIGKAAVQDSRGKYVRAHMIHFSWKSACLACTGISSFLAVLFVRFIYLWQQCLLTSGASAWSVVQASLVLGTEIGLLVMAVLLILLVPRMIVTWTTAVVFEYMLGVVVSGRRQIVKEGTKVAREISWITLTNVFEEGNAVAAAVLLVCFTSTAVLRQAIAIG